MKNNRKSKEKFCVHGYDRCIWCSRIKMGFMLKREYQNGEKHHYYGSYIGGDHRSDEAIITGMLKRLEPRYKNAYNSIIFYDRGTEIRRIEHISITKNRK